MLDKSFSKVKYWILTYRGWEQTDDILNAILPPREWTEDGELWVQYVSAQPPTYTPPQLTPQFDQLTS